MTDWVPPADADFIAELLLAGRIDGLAAIGRRGSDKATLDFCAELLRLGRIADFAGIDSLPGAGDHAAVVHFADVGRLSALEYFSMLPTSDRAPFVKAVATYENTVGGIGSVTLLVDLVDVADDPQHDLYDWILRNTRSYGYYSFSARSYEEYLSERQDAAECTAANIRRDQERQARDRIRVAQQSTAKLYNAVRRGDIKAVQALLRRGADPATHTPDGEPLHAFALRSNRLDIAALLQSPIPRPEQPS